MSEFLDHLQITAKAGNGGNGCVSFRREKFVPRGGPNGGNGGRGGHVILRAHAALNTLAHIRPNAVIRAGRGGHGGGSDRTGAFGEDIVVKVPVGTIIRDAETREIIVDLVEDGQEQIVAEGGNGGRGNAAFASSVNRTPRYAQEGLKGEVRRVYLELKLLADVGIVGLPNAGKSTLTATLSAAKPLVASYPFTTLYPVLGVVKAGYDSFVIADIPGLIEGAHAGAGLGHQFLKHIERTRILLHLIDLGSPDAESPQKQADSLEKELHLYKEELDRKPRLIVGSKMDLNPSQERINAFVEWAEKKGYDHCFISSATKDGLEQLIQRLLATLAALKAEQEV